MPTFTTDIFTVEAKDLLIGLIVGTVVKESEKGDDKDNY